MRETCRTDPHWHFSRLDGPCARWISPAALDEQRRLLLPREFSRLWLNQWQAAADDALDPDDIEASLTLTSPLLHADGQHQFVAGLDLGVKNDHSALVVLALHPSLGRLRLAEARSWSPGPAGQVDLTTIEHALLDAERRYRLSAIYFDPWQALLLAQRLISAGLNMIEQPMTAGSLDLMARCLITVFRNRLIDLYPHVALLSDLKRMRLIEKSHHFRLDAPRDSTGHADVGMALCLTLPRGFQWLQTLHTDLS